MEYTFSTSLMREKYCKTYELSLCSAALFFPVNYQAQEITASPGSLSRPDIRSRMDLSSVPPVHSDPTGLNLKQLTRLHRSLKSTRHRRDRAEALYWESVEHAIWIEDLNTFRSKQ